MAALEAKPPSSAAVCLLNFFFFTLSTHMAVELLFPFFWIFSLPVRLLNFPPKAPKGVLIFDRDVTTWTWSALHLEANTSLQKR